MTRHVRLAAVAGGTGEAPADAGVDAYLRAGPEPAGTACVECESSAGTIYRTRRWPWAHAVPLHQACAESWFRPRAGQRLAATIEALAMRDAVLVEAAARFYRGLSMNEQANRLARELAHYREGAWRRERVLDHVPPRHVGKLPALLWQALRLRDHALSPRSVRFVLSVAPFSLPTSGSKELRSILRG